MADEELEPGEGGKKSPILAYILIGVGVIVALAITVLATMYFVGYFDPDSAERIEATVTHFHDNIDRTKLPRVNVESQSIVTRRDIGRQTLT